MITFCLYCKGYSDTAGFHHDYYCPINAPIYYVPPSSDALREVVDTFINNKLVGIVERERDEARNEARKQYRARLKAESGARAWYRLAVNTEAQLASMTEYAIEEARRIARREYRRRLKAEAELAENLHAEWWKKIDDLEAQLAAANERAEKAEKERDEALALEINNRIYIHKVVNLL